MSIGNVASTVFINVLL